MPDQFNVDGPAIPVVPTQATTGSRVQTNLDGSHLEQLNRVIQRSPNAIELAKAMQECGWECQQQLEQLLQQQHQATTAKRIFFPQMP